MITYTTPYTLASCDLTTSHEYDMKGEEATTYTYNVGYYDDTKIKQRLSLLETEVSDIQSQDVNFQYRLSLLEAHENDWATKSELQGVERRVTKLETVPVGLTPSEMDQILNS